MPEVSLVEALAAHTDYRARLRTLLNRYEPSILATRPPSGDWSAIENAGHLLAATQLHLGPFVPGGLGWTQLDVPWAGRAHSHITPPSEVAGILQEWDRVWADACRRLDLTDPDLAAEVPGRGVRLLSYQLGLRHLEQHGRQAARALSQVTGQVVRVPRASGKPVP